MTDPMHVTALVIHGYCGIEEASVTFDPDDHVVFVTGANAAGKTSFADALWAAIAGKQAAKAEPIRDGQDHAEVIVQFGDYRATRRWKRDGDTTLKVEDLTGRMTVKGPQAFLNEMFGPMSIDPHALASMSPKEQNAALASVLDLGFDPDAMADERKALFDERTGVNSELRRLQARLEGTIAPPDGTPEELVQSTAILAELQAAQASNAEFDRLCREVRNAEVRVQDQRGTVDSLTDQLAKAEALLDTCRDQLEASQAALNDAAPKADESVFAERLQGVEARNELIRAGQQRRALAAEIDGLGGEAKMLTNRIEASDNRKAAAIADALDAANLTMPLDLSDDGITLNGVPLQQCSTAEQVLAGIELGVAGNPKLKVLRIGNGEALDRASLAQVTAKAEANDLMLLIEAVEESGTVGIYIADGKVAAINGEPTTTQPKEAVHG